MMQSAPAVLSRFVRHVRRPALLPKLILKNVLYPFSIQAAEKRYDRRLGIDTVGSIEPGELDISREAAERSYAYTATPPAIARFLISRVAKRAHGFTFVDIGSGKGRVLLTAARFPFRQVVGLEQSADLNQIAARNIRHFAESLLHASAPQDHLHPL